MIFQDTSMFFKIKTMIPLMLSQCTVLYFTTDNILADFLSAYTSSQSERQRKRKQITSSKQTCSSLVEVEIQSASNENNLEDSLLGTISYYILVPYCKFRVLNISLTGCSKYAMVGSFIVCTGFGANPMPTRYICKLFYEE